MKQFLTVQTMSPLQLPQRMLGVGMVCLCLLGSGCVSEGKKKAPVNPAVSLSDRVTIIGVNLLSMPVAQNLDQIPGPDGVSIKAYVSSLEHPKTVPVTIGKLEVLMFDGLLHNASDPNSKPLKVWSFSPAQLKGNAFQSSIGTGYEFTLAWETDKPKSSKVTIVARFVPPSGQPVYSAANSITVIDQ